MKRHSRHALLCVFGLVLFLAATRPTRAAEALPQAPAKFTHPGCFYTQADLDFMKKKIAAKEEPWFSAWQKFVPSGKDTAWTAHPAADWDANNRVNGFYMAGDPLVAHKLALAWALTGKQAYADKAIEILNAWSSTLKTVQEHKMPQEKLASGINVENFVNAAELLRYATPDGKKSGWAEPDIERFKKMLLIFDNTMKDFQPGYNGNWDAIMMDSTICSAVFLDDKDMFNRVIKHYVVGVKPNGGLTNYVSPTGQPQEAYRDFGHVQWGLGGLVAVCQVAWSQGVDLYSIDDNRLMVGLEYTAKYLLGGDVPYAGRGKISKRSGFAPIWEAAYQHYHYVEGLDMPFTEKIIKSESIKKGRTTGPYRPEEDYAAGISWGTLTMFKGAEDPQAKKH